MKKSSLSGELPCNWRVMAKCLRSVRWHWKSKPWQVAGCTESQKWGGSEAAFSLLTCSYTIFTHYHEVQVCQEWAGGYYTKAFPLNSPVYRTISPPPLQKYGDLKIVQPWITTTAIYSPLICHLPIRLRKVRNPVVYCCESWCIRHWGHLISENCRSWNTTGKCHALLSSA